ncbi:Dihydrofolate reductase [compost metagenome]
MLIGGAQLYAQGLEQADRLYLTRVELAPEGDAFCPEVPAQDWRLASSIEHGATADTPAYAFQVWERR